MSQQPLDQFTAACYGIYQAGTKLKPKYYATRFLKMVQDHGGKDAADQLLATSDPSDGFSTLYLSGVQNLKISLEYHVLQNPWRSLFTPEQRAVARERLLKVGSQLPPEDQE